jgi:hypothetical protein
VLGTITRVAALCFVVARIDTMVSAGHVVAHVGPLAALSFMTYAAVALITRRRARRSADSWIAIANQAEALRLEERVLAAYGLSWPEPEPGLRPSASSVAADA